MNWYSAWWGIALVVLFFYILVPYIVWTKTTWHKAVKVGITLVCLFFIFGAVNPHKVTTDSEKIAKNETHEIQTSQTVATNTNQMLANETTTAAKSIYSRNESIDYTIKPQCERVCLSKR